MSTIHHTPVATGAAANASTINSPLSELDSGIVALAQAVVAGSGGAATTLASTAAAAATTISVVDASGFEDGMYIDIELDSGGIHATTVNGAPSGNTITLADAMPSQATASNYVSSPDLETVLARDTFDTLGDRLDTLLTGANVTDVSATSSNIYGVEMTANNDATTGSGLVYGIRIATYSETVDRASGMAIVNTGAADAFYIDNQGKTGAASSPTAIGIDLNKGFPSGERDDEMSGYGIQIYDRSTTNQGANGPHMIYLFKLGNKDTDHPMIELNGNRHAIRILVDPTTGSYDGQASIISAFHTDGPDEIWRFNANGNLTFIEDGVGISFDDTPNQAGSIKQASSRIDIRMASDTNGLRILKNSDNSLLLQIDQNGVIDLRGTMGTSTKDPSAVAEDGWLQFERNGTPVYVPYYNAS